MDLILENADDMAHYIPGREDILKYADDTYIEMTPQLEKLKVFIINNMNAGEEPAADVVDDVELVIDDEPILYEAGGNDLCPCGSGKKYKDCCGEMEEYF